jgi:hypothetical protein
MHSIRKCNNNPTHPHICYQICLIPPYRTHPSRSLQVIFRISLLWALCIACVFSEVHNTWASSKFVMKISFSCIGPSFHVSLQWTQYNKSDLQINLEYSYLFMTSLAYSWFNSSCCRKSATKNYDVQNPSKPLLHSTQPNLSSWNCYLHALQYLITKTPFTSIDL